MFTYNIIGSKLMIVLRLHICFDSLIFHNILLSNFSYLRIPTHPYIERSTGQSDKPFYTALC